MCFVIREIADMEGIGIGGHNVNNIRCAEDTVLIADTEDELRSKI